MSSLALLRREAESRDRPWHSPRNRKDAGLFRLKEFRGNETCGGQRRISVPCPDPKLHPYPMSAPRVHLQVSRRLCHAQLGARCRPTRSKCRFRQEKDKDRLRRDHLKLFRRSEEHTSELQSHHDLVCRLLLEKKK